MESLAILLAQEPAAPPLPWWPVYLIIGVMFYFIVFAPDRKRKQVQDEMMNSLKKNDKVVTAGGIFGSVVNVQDDSVVLRVDENTNTRIRVQRGSISRVIQEKEGSEEAAK